MTTDTPADVNDLVAIQARLETAFALSDMPLAPMDDPPTTEHRSEIKELAERYDRSLLFAAAGLAADLESTEANRTRAQIYLSRERLLRFAASQAPAYLPTGPGTELETVQQRQKIIRMLAINHNRGCRCSLGSCASRDDS